LVRAVRVPAIRSVWARVTAIRQRPADAADVAALADLAADAAVRVVPAARQVLERAVSAALRAAVDVAAAVVAADAAARAVSVAVAAPTA